jgi:hypothetical protein
MRALACFITCLTRGIVGLVTQTFQRQLLQLDR